MALHRILSREVLRIAGQWAWSQLQGAAATQSAGAPSRTQNPLEKWTDHDLVRAAAEGAEASGGVQLEMMRRLKDSLEGGQRSVVVLTRRIERLTVRLLWIAIVLAALTIVQVVIVLKMIG